MEEDKLLLSLQQKIGRLRDGYLPLEKDLKSMLTCTQERKRIPGDLSDRLITSLQEMLQVWQDCSGISESLKAASVPATIAGLERLLSEASAAAQRRKATARAELFLHLEAKDPSVQSALKSQQEKLHHIMQMDPKDEEREKALKPYLDFMDTLLCEDDGKKMASFPHLMQTFDNTLLGAAFLGHSVTMSAQDTAVEPEQITEPEKTQPDEEPSVTANEPATVEDTAVDVSEPEETKEEPSPEKKPDEELDGKTKRAREREKLWKDFQRPGMLLPADYDYGSLHIGTTRKDTIPASSSELRSDLHHLNFGRSCACYILHRMSMDPCISKETLMAGNTNLEREFQKAEFDAALSMLQKRGYIHTCTMDGLGTVFTVTPRTRHLYTSKKACKILDITPWGALKLEKTFNEVPSSVAGAILYNAMMTRWMNNAKNIFKQYAGHFGFGAITFTMDCAHSINPALRDVVIGLVGSEADTASNLGWLPFHLSNMRDDPVEEIKDTPDAQSVTLAGMEKEPLEALRKALSEKDDYAFLLKNRVYYYLLPEHQLYDENWNPTEYYYEKDDPDDPPVNPSDDKPVKEESEPEEEVPSEPVQEPQVTEHEPVPGTAPQNLAEESADASVPDQPVHEPETAQDTVDAEPIEESAQEPSAKPAGSAQKEVQLTGEERQEIRDKVVKLLQKDNLPCAMAYLGYSSSRHEELNYVYQKLAYAVHAPSMPHGYSSGIVYESFAGSDSVLDSYLCTAAACRTFFYNDTEYDYHMHALQSLTAGTELLQGSQPLTELIYALMEFKSKYHKGVDFYADYRMKNQKAWERHIQRIQRDASDLYDNIIEKPVQERARQKRFIETKKILFAKDGEIATGLHIVKENALDELDMVKDILTEFVKDDMPVAPENISEDKIIDIMNEAWVKATKTMLVVKKTSDLMGSLRNNLIKALTKVATVLCQWVQAASQQPVTESDEGFIAYRKQRASILLSIRDSLAELDAPVPDKEARAGKNVLHRCLEELQSRLDGSFDVNTNRYFYIDFLRDNRVLLNDDYQLDFHNWYFDDDSSCYLEDIESYAENHLPSLEERIKNIFDGADDYQEARLIDDYLLDTTGHSFVQENPDCDLDKSIDFARKDAQKRLEDFIENLEWAQSSGQIDNTQENRKENILQMVSECYEYACASTNFGVFRRVTEYFGKKIKEDAKERGDVLQEQLNDFRKVAKDDDASIKRLDRIQQLITGQEYTVAEDMLRRWNANEPEEMASPLMNETDHLRKFIENYNFYSDKVNQAKKTLLSLLPKQQYQHSKGSRAGYQLAQSWIRGNQVDEGQMKTLLQNLGWKNVDTVERQKSANGKMIVFHVKLQKPKNGRRSNYQHPIAAFGSQAEREGFRVACLFGQYDATELMERFRELGNTKNTLVMLDYALKLADRRRLARKIKSDFYGQKVFAVIDRVDIMYLIDNYSEMQVNRILMMLIMPFSVYQPYVWESSNVMPPEIFMGRRKELAKIEDANGVNIVYGGRQLGKSALLKMARTDIDHNENNDRAILVDIKDRGYRDAARQISHKLTDEGFFKSPVDTGDWDELSRAISNRLRSEEDYIPYFLLMLDEADAFIESCEAISYRPFDALKDIQSLGSGRFKFVIAGLRNIVRFNRDRALGNNSVITHLAAMTVKPFDGSEARELLQEPLYYLGLRFPQEKDVLTPLILANTNYFPGLIQLYCAKLIEAMTKDNYAGYNEGESPIYQIEKKHIKKVLSDSSFTEQIKEKFEITLKLGNDRYYYIIALIMAHLYHEHGGSSGYLPEHVLDIADGFDIPDIRELTLENIKALMDELCELNVLRTTPDERYLFSRYTFFQMMGNAEDVWDKLDKLAE